MKKNLSIPFDRYVDEFDLMDFTELMFITLMGAGLFFVIGKEAIEYKHQKCSQEATENE